MPRYVIVRNGNEFVEYSGDLARAYLRRNELEVELGECLWVKLTSDWKG